jgi:predicted transcriptional regulator
MNTAINTILSDFGLTNNEIKVYLEALKHKESNPFQLAKLTGIARTTVYDVLTSLSLKGLIELAQNEPLQKQQTRIKAKDPSVMRQIVRDKRSDLTKLEVGLVSILSLLKQSKADQNSELFKFLPGIEGAKEALSMEDTDDVDAEELVFDDMTPMDALGSSFSNKSSDTASSRNKGRKHTPKKLIPWTEWTKHVIGYQTARNPEYITLREFRYLENPVFEINQRINIKASRIIITTSHKQENWGLVISSESLAATMRSLFYMLWQTATPVNAATIKQLGKNEYFEAENKQS